MTRDEEENAVRQLCTEIGHARVAHHVHMLWLKENPTGFFATLTPEQQKAALDYRGEDC